MTVQSTKAGTGARWELLGRQRQHKCVGPNALRGAPHQQTEGPAFLWGSDRYRVLGHPLYHHKDRRHRLGQKTGEGAGHCCHLTHRKAHVRDEDLGWRGRSSRTIAIVWLLSHYFHRKNGYRTKSYTSVEWRLLVYCLFCWWCMTLRNLPKWIIVQMSVCSCVFQILRWLLEK